MAVTATGIFKDLTMLQLLVASCPTFQSIVKKPTLATAQAHVHKYAAIDEFHTIPRATVTPHDWERVALSRNNFRSHVSMRLSFELAAPEEYVLEGPEGFNDQSTWFTNRIGAIVAEMEDREGLGEPLTGLSHLAVNRISVLQGPWFNRPGTKQEMELASSGKFPAVVWNIVFAVEVS